MKALLRLLLLLLLLLPLALAMALFSEPGSRAVLQMVSHYTPVQIEFGGGKLAGQFRLERLALATDSMSLEVTSIEGELAPRCLWRSAICFRQLQARSLVMDFPPASDDVEVTVPPGRDTDETALFEFPVQVESGDLVVDNVTIRWQGGEWRQLQARMQLHLRQSRVEILQAVLQQPMLVLQDTGEPPGEGRRHLGRINLPLKLSVGQLALERPAWDFYGSSGNVERLSLRGRWRNTDLHIANLEAQSQRFGRLSLNGDIAFTDDWPLMLHSKLMVARPPGWELLHQRSIQLDASGRLAAMALEISSEGTPSLALTGQLDLLDRELPFESVLELAWPEGQRLGELEAMPPLLAEVILDEPLTASLYGNLLKQHIELQAVASGLGYHRLRLGASASHQEGRAWLHELHLVDAAGTSELRGSGEIELSEDLRASLLLSSSGFELPQLTEYAFGRLQGSLQFHAHSSTEGWQLRMEDVDLAGYINDLPALIHGHGGLGSDLRLAQSDLQADFNGARLLLRHAGEQSQDGRFELAIDDLGRWQPGSRGGIELTGQFSSNFDELQFEGGAIDLQWEELQVEQGTLRGHYRADDGQSFDATLKLADIQLGDRTVASLQARLAGTAPAHTLLVTGAGNVAGELRLDGAWTAGKWQGELAAGHLQTPQQRWQLAAPVDLAWTADAARLSLAAHCWRQAGASICPGPIELGENSQGSLTVDGDIGFLAGLLPEGVTLDGQMRLHLEGSWNAADGLLLSGQSATRGVLLSGQLGEGEEATLGWDEGEADINYDRRGLQLDWRTRRGGEELLRLTLVLPPERDASLSGELFLNRLELATLGRLSPALSTLKGEISGRVQLAGSVDQPLASGLLQLADGELALVGNPTRLESLQLELALHGDSAELRGRGQLGKGDLVLDGTISSRPEWRLDLAVTGDQQTILYPPSVELLVSTSLQLSATPGLLDLRGNIDVHQGILEPEQLPEGSVAVSADVVEVDYAGNVIREELPFDLSMDVRIHVHDRFQVSSALINATLGGNLQLRQQRRRPLQVYGNLNIIRGEVRAYQQSLRVTRGTLAFTGRPDNPALDIRAQRNISGSNVEVGVQLLGTLDQLTLDVYSEPPMSQGEAMSYLVRGRGLDASAGAEGTALALSMASGVVNRSTLVTELNRIPGVNNVAFGADGGADDTAATVSGYLGNRIYLSYGVGLYEPINVLTARLYLRSRLWLEVVSRLENSIDLYYSFDID